MPGTVPELAAISSGISPSGLRDRRRSMPGAVGSPQERRPQGSSAEATRVREMLQQATSALAAPGDAGAAADQSAASASSIRLDAQLPKLPHVKTRDQLFGGRRGAEGRE